MIDKSEIKKKLKESPDAQIGKIPLLVLFIGIFFFLGILVLIAHFFEGENVNFLSCITIALVAFLVFIGKMLSLIKKRLKEWAIHCPKCNSQFLTQDMKLVMVTDKCPYCGEKIINNV
ncbi:MAG: hypothetical protein MJA31_18720 [Clostridia bacterium]|nr:hypothetical protein [Clostridia bacterium]